MRDRTWRLWVLASEWRRADIRAILVHHARHEQPSNLLSSGLWRLVAASTSGLVECRTYTMWVGLTEPGT